MNKLIKKTRHILLPLLLGSFVFYWVYRDFDFKYAATVLSHKTNWIWMILSLVFGGMSHVIRGWRWKQTLVPLGTSPKTSHCIDAIFIAYAVNLLLPRVGEVSRCSALARYDSVPFAKSLGTVVTERIIDAILTVMITITIFLLQMPIFLRFFEETGTKIPSAIHLLSSPWFYVSLFSVAGILVLLYYVLRMFSVFDKVRGTAINIWTGILSLRRVSNKPLFLLYTAGIWVCYFMQFYLTFFCFPFTSHLGWQAGMVMFIGGTFAVIVPTPNGAGPWHFAVITMMMLYGVSDNDASTFALLVHAIHTLLVLILGMYGWINVSLSKKIRR